MKKPTIDAIIDKIEQAIFDSDEPGCCDTKWGDMVINSIGRIRLRKIIRDIRRESRGRTK